MASNYRFDIKRHEESVQQWVEEVIRDRLWEKYDDLHIDVLARQFKRPSHWVEASLLLVKYLFSIIDKSQYAVLLVIRLEAKAPISSETLQLDNLEQYMGMTPPSFYLFPLHSTVLEETILSALYLPALGVENKWKVYFKEEKEDDEYYGTVLVMP